MNQIPAQIEENLFRKKTSAFPKSPLRYPGGKARAVDIMLALMPSDIQTLVAPFLGGGSVEIAAAHCGLRVYGYDIFSPLVDFWQEILTDPDQLADHVEAYYPLSKERFYQLQRSTFSNRLESATVFYVLNRSSFSGSTLSGGMSPGHPRFTLSAIEYLRAFRCPNMTVEEKDFQQTLTEHPDDFLYLDPPYMISSTLYGKKGNTHRDFDHSALNDMLRTRDRWILSYNDCPDIRRLYKGYRCLTPRWKYGMSSDKDSRELLILSNDLPEVIGVQSDNLWEGF
jgi:DNA adenine methylase